MGNKLIYKDYVVIEEISVDTALSSTSTNPVQNKVINTALGKKQDKLTIDTALSSTSTNPVQNKVINTALGNKQDKLEWNDVSDDVFSGDFSGADGANACENGHVLIISFFGFRPSIPDVTSFELRLPIKPFEDCVYPLYVGDSAYSIVLMGLTQPYGDFYLVFLNPESIDPQAIEIEGLYGQIIIPFEP